MVDIEKKISSNGGVTPLSKITSDSVDEATLEAKKSDSKYHDTIQPMRTEEIAKNFSCELPTLQAPDKEKTEGASLTKAVEEIKKNPFFAKSFLAVFYNFMDELLNLQRDVRLSEAQNELRIRKALYDLAKDSGALAKLLMDDQAREQMVQACASFANAGVSAVSFVQTARNTGAAKREVESEIEKKKQDINGNNLTGEGSKIGSKIEFDDAIFGKGGTAGQSQGSIDDERQAKINELTRPLKPGEERTVEQSKQKAAYDKWQKDERELEGMEVDKIGLIYRKTQHNDQLVQTLNEGVFKQTINGTTSVLSSTIKTDMGTKEQLQKLIEGFMQAMNKYLETASKNRDDAASNYGRYTDFLNRIVESTSRSFYVSGKA